MYVADAWRRYDIGVCALVDTTCETTRRRKHLQQSRTNQTLGKGAPDSVSLVPFACTRDIPHNRLPLLLCTEKEWHLRKAQQISKTEQQITANSRVFVRATLRGVTKEVLPMPSGRYVRPLAFICCLFDDLSVRHAKNAGQKLQVHVLENISVSVRRLHTHLSQRKLTHREWWYLHQSPSHPSVLTDIVNPCLALSPHRWSFLCSLPSKFLLYVTNDNDAFCGTVSCCV